MVVNNRNLVETDRRRRQLVRQFYELLDDLESRPVKRQTASGFPFSLLERFIGWSLDRLERAASRLVSAAFRRLKPPRGRHSR